jgi:hypothetical protein
MADKDESFLARREEAKALFDAEFHLRGASAKHLGLTQIIVSGALSIGVVSGKDQVFLILPVALEYLVTVNLQVWADITVIAAGRGWLEQLVNENLPPGEPALVYDTRLMTLRRGLVWHKWTQLVYHVLNLAGILAAAVYGYVVAARHDAELPYTIAVTAGGILSLLTWVELLLLRRRVAKEFRNNSAS